MAGPKQSFSLPAKKPKSKAAKPPTATKPSLSSEFVVDSDDSGDTKTARVNRPAPKTTKSNSISTKPEAPKPLTSQAKPSKKQKSLSRSPAKDDSSGSGSGNDSSSQYEKKSSKKMILAAQDGNPTAKPKPAMARPVFAKPSIKAFNSVKPLDQKKDRGLGGTGNESKSDAGGSSADSSSVSESGSESESGSSDKTSVQSPRKESPVQKSIPEQPIPIYEPPAGFESTSISFHAASKLSEILAPSNLQGKQIWHITAPESVPISSVKEVSTKNIGNGASVLEYHGAKYGLIPESDAEQASSRALLLPSTQTNDYRPSKTAVIKTLHLQQLVSLPSHALGSTVHQDRSASASESYRKTPRQQPEGLRIRYRPFGVSDDSDMESTFEPMLKAPEFRTPAPLNESSPGKKRKRPESNDGSGNTFSAVKPKKRNQSPQITTGVIKDTMEIDATPDKGSNGAESPTRSPQPEINGVKFNGKWPNGTETKNERRRRREKKKLEQQELPPKPATALPLDVIQAAEIIQPGEVVEGAPAIANAVEGKTSINDISPQKESKEEKAKRREERRRRKEIERATRGASLISAEDMSQREVADSQDKMIQEIENAQRDASIQISTPKDGSTQNQSRTAHESQNPTLDSNQTSQRKETREERAKRKEEKRRRKMESGSA